MSIPPCTHTNYLARIFPNNTWDCQKIYNRSVYYPFLYLFFLAILKISPQLMHTRYPDDLEAKTSPYSDSRIRAADITHIFSYSVIWKSANMWSMAEILVGMCSQPSPGLLLSSGHKGKGGLKDLFMSTFILKAQTKGEKKKVSIIFTECFNSFFITFFLTECFPLLP